MGMDVIKELSCAEFGDFLLRKGFHEDIVLTFNENRICGQAFCEMTEEDLKELLPVIGDRIRIRKLMKEVVPQDLVRTNRSNIIMIM